MACELKIKNQTWLQCYHNNILNSMNIVLVINAHSISSDTMIWVRVPIQTIIYFKLHISKTSLKFLHLMISVLTFLWPHLLSTVGFPRLVEELSITSSCTRLAVWIISDIIATCFWDWDILQSKYMYMIVRIKKTYLWYSIKNWQINHRQKQLTCTNHLHAIFMKTKPNITV